MGKITLISTVHKENGKCNPNELGSIIEELAPEVIFLEALKDTYSDFDKFRFENFQLYHNKLELAAIQRFGLARSFEYVPVLDDGMADIFEKKYERVSKSSNWRQLFDRFNDKAREIGFDFLNSHESISFHEDLRSMEPQIIGNSKIINEFNDHLENYENTMLRNIAMFCEANQFEKAIFMCGVGHRKSMIEKVTKETFSMPDRWEWVIYGQE